ncbi:uncharacterized protein LOC116345888 [Contarinia nasturtii]|uniref:uncharacterized protein LOC116345888 n=1 Tax=Contarinia nasturtii TaxID=265458 RepID=UPI0012D44278|nr:uncharacterized protein LOC116345888 [Contarinia nasturtii]
MKFLVTCILFSTIMLVNADVSRLKSDRSIFGLFGENDHDSIMTPEQRKCMGDELKKLAIQYPELKHWFEDIEKFINSMVEKQNECLKLPEMDKFKCMLETLLSARDEWEQLTAQLTEEQEGPILEKVKSIEDYCFEQ